MSRITRDFNRTTPRSNLPNNIKSNTPITPSQQEQALPIKDPQQVSSPGPSNIERKTRYTKSNKVLIKTDPGSLVMTGMSNTISDYGGIVDGNYKDKSILNQSIGKAFEGDWEGAGTLIRENPLRFAGNLLVEAGANIIPVGGLLKVAKVAKVANKIREGTVNKITKVINNKLSDDVPIPEGQTRLYQMTNKNDSSWFSLKQPKEFYAKRVTSLNDASTYGPKKNMYAGMKETDAVDLRKEGIELGDARPELKYIDVKDADLTTYNVGKLIDDSGVNNKLKQEWIPPTSNPNQQPPRSVIAGLPNDFVPITNTPGKIGTSSATDFFNYPDAQGKPVGRYLKETTLDPLGEWVLPLSYQKNVKLLAKQKETEPWVNRLFNPYLTQDKMANKLVKIVQTNKEKKLRKNQYDHFNPGTQNTSFGLADDQLRRLDDIHEADVVAKEIKIRFPKQNKDYLPFSGGFLAPPAVSTISKGQAAVEGYYTKRVDKNAGLFGGYGQFLQ